MTNQREIHVKGHEFTCAHCHGVFIENRDFEEANRECEEQWGVRGDSLDMDRVCDKCYTIVMMRMGHT